ncbi:MAG: 2-C-methyl-D-erythritol 2,4-cyclodiphosphate synthase [Gammaproteobacteria bacterium]|nr:2-C-methyl-D-erythritol 2,4-cyclodiphosphate synthase [Gammaproteobacteria bacterium]
MRVGQGFDVHPLVPNRRLILGGVAIPFEKGLDGHSDADVVMHAVCDAILGAAGLGDCGRYFPDHDPKYKNIASHLLLEQVVEKIEIEHYRVVNADITIIAEEPKLSAYFLKMVENLARTLQCTPECVNVKAKTSEKMGFLGRKEGIAALAVVLLEKVRVGVRTTHSC